MISFCAGAIYDKNECVCVRVCAMRIVKHSPDALSKVRIALVTHIQPETLAVVV